ncbi:MAG: M1 family metallopeptidase, partial [Proteobacteria bacterium]|nr:M1 family metallopeptidase [Pseudomonadota bacterium]
MPFAEPGVKPNYGPSRTFVIEHLLLKLRIDPDEKQFSGTATFKMRPLPTFAGIVTFDLDEVVVTAVEDGSGTALIYSYDDGKIAIKTEACEIAVIKWRGNNPTRGLYFTHSPKDVDEAMAWTQCQDEDGHFVFPCHDHPGVKHPWTIEIEAPPVYTVLSNGRLVRTIEGEEWETAVYEQSEPMPAYLFTAVVARLSVVESSWGEIPVRYLVPWGDEEAVVRSMGKTPLMIEEISRFTGVDYPWPRYDQVVVYDFIFGGMENTACTTMTDLLLVDDKAILEWDPDALVSHELAHQWFGDLVTCQDWSQAWLNESWATYVECLWWESDRSLDETTWYRYRTAAEYLEEDGQRYRRPIVSYEFRNPIDVFDRHLYQKGCCVLHTLRCEMGDEPFFAGLNQYLTRHRHQTVHTRHFQRAMEDATGLNLDQFFDQWIHSAGHPALKVKLSEEETLLIVKVEQTQSHSETPEAFCFTLPLELVFDDDRRQLVKLPIKERQRTWAIPTEGAVKFVRVDPDFSLLGTIELDAPNGWLTALSADPCPVLATRAVKALLKDGAVQAVNAARDAMMGHPFWGVRGAAASEIGKRGGSECRQWLIEALDNEADPRVLRYIALALGAFRHKDAATALIELINSDPETWQLCGAALKSLGKTRDDRAHEVLLAHLQVESWGQLVRNNSLMGLAYSQKAEALETLLAHSVVGQPNRV